jgi:hypothetical protein
MLLRLATAFVAAAIGTLALASAPASAAPRTRGKVVRVERARGSKAPPKVCDIRGDKSGTCLGSEPVIGEILTVLDENGVVADARIIEVKPFRGGSTTACEAWDIRTEVLRGSLSVMTARAMGLIDHDLHPKLAHILPNDQFPSSPSGRLEDTVVMAFDRDGDRTADLVLTQTQCDATGGTCIDHWGRVGGRLTRIQQTNFASCGN